MGWGLLEAWQERRRRKRGHRGGSTSTCDGCDGCLAFEACDGCGGCDLNLRVLSLGALLRVVPVPRTPPVGPVRQVRFSPAARGALALIGGYQRYVSARTPARCRFVPSCSEYGAQAVRHYGLHHGARLTAARIRRCTRGTPHGTSDPLR